MKKIIIAFCCYVLLFSTATSSYTVNAASVVAGFPLPVTGSPYYVTVLNRYSNGGEHSSYINKYVLGKSTAPENIVMDISATSGTNVYAVADGNVITSTYSNGGGNYIVIKHNDGTYSYYGHLSSKNVSKGNFVSQGQIIGYVGKTGSASGYHLHFEWSGHDPYCEFAAKGYVQIYTKSGASEYPHTHAIPSTADISFSNIRAENITKEDAKIIGTINNPKSAKVTRVRVIVQEGGTGEVWSYTEDCGLTKSSFNLWYNLKSEWRSLKEATAYYYYFKAEVNGQWYTSETYRFNTIEDVAPTISDVKVENVSSGGYDISCVVDDNSTVAKVEFPTWTAYNGQDDLIWYDATYANSRWSFHVNVANHNNETGIYITHIYAYDTSNNCTFASAGDIYIPTWEEKNQVEVRFDSQGGSSVPSVYTTLGMPMGLDKRPPDPVKEGYRFLGWYNQYGSDWNFESSVVGIRNLVLYAKWELVDNGTQYYEYDDSDFDIQENIPDTEEDTDNIPITTIKKLKSGSKRIMVYWRHVENVDGYQIQYSLSKKFLKSKVKSYSDRTGKFITIKKLKPHKKYYIRVRTYKVISGKKYYSEWSNTKSIKTKR